jgi:predicted small secreted protein
MRKISALAAIAMLSLLGTSCLTAADSKGEDVSSGGFGVLMMTDKPVYSPGEVITMTLQVFNRTEERVAFHFRTSQRYDFLIDESGNKVWQWSDGMVFAMVLGEETIKPGSEDLIYRTRFEKELSPGSYKITGILVDKDRPMSGSVTILIR